jgi:flagellar assembly protein FliH
LPDVLRTHVAGAEVHRLRLPRPVLDPATSVVLDEAVERARAEAFEEGRAAGRAENSADLGRAATAVTGAVDALRAELATTRTEATRASLELARRIAVAVVDGTPPPEATEVLARVRDAIALLDDAPMRVQLSPGDADRLEGARLDGGVELIADPTLRPGEARIAGPCSGADLTRSALLDAAIELLGDEAS